MHSLPWNRRWRNACLAAAIALAACLCGGALAYDCEGPGCCHATCGGNESCRKTEAGPVPSWWPKDSCADLVAHNYDATIACSAAAAPGDPCGGDEPFACGYGLVCVAETITAAHCAPVCDEHYADTLLHADSVAAGCMLDVPRTSYNDAVPGERVPVGDVSVVNGTVAVPTCVLNRNLYHDGLARVGSGAPGPVAAHERAVGNHQARVELASQVTALNLLFFEVRAYGCFHAARSLVLRQLHTGTHVHVASRYGVCRRSAPGRSRLTARALLSRCGGGNGRRSRRFARRT